MEKVLLHGYVADGNLPYCKLAYSFYDPSTGEFTEHCLDQFDNTGADATPAEFYARAIARIISYAGDTSRTIVESDIGSIFALAV